MPFTRTGIPLRSIPAGDGHIAIQMKHAIYNTFIGVMLCAASLSAEDDTGKPEHEVSYIGEKEMIELATAKLREAGLHKKYDDGSALLVKTPSQMGEEYVAFCLPKRQRDKNGYIRLDCLVIVNSILGRVGILTELPDKGGTIWFAHLDKDGKVTGYKTKKSQQKGAANSGSAGAPPE